MSVIHGGAPGADQLAKVWAQGSGVPYGTHDADWEAPCPPQCPPGHRKTRRCGGDCCPTVGHPA
ncbi:SLOG family protein [Streptomyces sp. ISL-98]|uniref:SLOG family protein n=1 Tax=Streptomyces sp. ISL-98 TaxID=2819192 RepID=UPI0035B25F4F